MRYVTPSGLGIYLFIFKIATGHAHCSCMSPFQGFAFIAGYFNIFIFQIALKGRYMSMMGIAHRKQQGFAFCSFNIRFLSLSHLNLFSLLLQKQ